MADNDFKIKISAQDQASEVVRRVGASAIDLGKGLDGVSRGMSQTHAANNRYVGAIARGMSQAGAAAKTQGSVVERAMARATKIVGGLGQGVSAVGAATKEAASGLGALNGPLGELAGLGAGVGLASLAGGVAEMAREWGELGIATKNTAANIGMSGDHLRSLGGAASIAGASAEGMANSLTGLGNSLNDAFWGRNAGAVGLLSQLHIGISRTADGSIDAEKAMRDLAGVMPGLSAQTQNMIAAQLGVSDVLPVLRQGTAAWDAYAAKQAALRPQIDGLVEKQSELGQSVREFGQVLGSVGDSFVDKFAGKLKNVVDTMTEMVKGSKDFLTTPIYETIGKWWRGDGGKSGKPQDAGGSAPAIIGSAQAAAKPMSGAAGSVPAPAPGAASPASLVRIPGQAASADKVMDSLVAKGWTREQAAGMTANLGRESSFRANAVGDGGQAYGLAQWHPDRQRNFARWARRDIHGSSVEEQLGFMDYELRQGNEKPAGKRLMAAQSPEQAGQIVSRLYERPKDAGGEAAIRGQEAAKIADQAVSVTVRFENAPGGITASARGDSGPVPVRVASPMPASGV